MGPNGNAKTKTARPNQERGVVLVLGILFLLLLTLIGIAALTTVHYDLSISGSKRISEQAFYCAEAGVNEVLGRFRPGATGEITDAAPSNPNWRLFLATNGGEASRIGYSSANPSHLFSQSLQNLLNYAVEVKHKVNIANSVVLHGEVPVYIVRSHGSTPEGGRKLVEVEMEKIPSLDPPGALYSERPVNVQGSSTTILGKDQCGTMNKPGIAVTLSSTTPGAVDVFGSPTIDGTPPVKYDSPNLKLKETVDYLKGDANFKYYYTSNQTLSGYSNSWGIPVSTGTSTPISYSGPMSIVYFKMAGTSTLKLSGGSHGAGILLVDGNLDLNGGFTWYGLIIVTGALDYTGGGQKNVTGGIMAGESTTVQVDVGGNAGILYCSKIADQLKPVVSPYRLTRWREVY